MATAVVLHLFKAIITPETATLAIFAIQTHMTDRGRCNSSETNAIFYVYGCNPSQSKILICCKTLEYIVFVVKHVTSELKKCLKSETKIHFSPHIKPNKRSKVAWKYCH